MARLMDADAQLELCAASGNEKPVFGISEWMCYYANYGKSCPRPETLDERVELHLQAEADGMSLYQSETLVRMEYLAQLLSDVGLPAYRGGAGECADQTGPAATRDRHGLATHIGTACGRKRATPRSEGELAQHLFPELRENVRTKLHTLIKRTLRRHGYPPDEQEQATRTVLE